MSNPVVQLFNDSGMSIREFATKADLKYSTAHDIVTGKANIENIGAGAFVRIARVFNTTADALISASDLTDSSASLTPDERTLVDAFRNVKPWAKDMILAQAKALSIHAKEEE